MGFSFDRFVKSLAINVSTLVLTACGGGGGSASPPPTPPPTNVGPTAEDLNSASLGKFAVLFKPESKEVVLRWVDSFTTESAYRVERQTDGATWQLQETLAATPANGTTYTWQRVVDTSATYRVVAQRDGYVVPLQTERGQSSIQIDLAAAVPQLVLNQQPPLRETVQLSVEGASTALSVLYFVDVDGFVDSATGPSFGVTWNTRNRTDGNHALYANVNYSNGLTIELPHRTVEVDNPNVAVALINPTGHQTNDQLVITALATSEAGVRQVEFFVNAASVAVQTTPATTDTWSYIYDTSGLPTGPVTVRIVATDNAGDQAEASRQVDITHAPSVSLVAPTDGAIVRDTLNVFGTVTDDQPGTVVTAFLGDVRLFETGGGSLAQSHSLTGIAPGQYTLRLQARDASGVVTTLERAVVVTAVTAFSYEYVATGRSPIALYDTDGGQLIYRLTDRTMRRRAADGSDVGLINSQQIDHDYPWHLSGGNVTTPGTGVNGSPAIFLWDPSGTQSEFPYTLQAGERLDFLRSELHGSWLVWGSNRLYLRNLAAQTPDVGPISVGVPAGHAFVTTSGSEKLFFTRTTSQPPQPDAIDLFVYDVASGATTPVTSADAWHTRPQADATRVVWQSVPVNTSFIQPFQLREAPVNNPTASIVRSANANSAYLADGLLAWVEFVSNAFALKVHDGASETLVSHTTSTTLYSTSDGAVVFSESGKLYIWNAAQGKRLLLEVLPKRLVQGDNEIYLTTGSAADTVHRTTY